MKQINVIQFLPYFSPHKWWVENMAEWFSKNYVKNNYWEVINVVFWVWQKIETWEFEKDWYKIFVLPAFDMVKWYPVPKIWRKEFWKILKETGLKIKKDRSQNEVIIQTHTRFFLSSFLGLIFAKINKIKSVHIEHGSGYVVWLNWFKRFIAFIYDNTLWRITFALADKIVVISEKNIDFVSKFTSKKPILIYNWIDFNSCQKTESDTTRIVYIWRLVKLKWVDILLRAIHKLKIENRKLKVLIVGDWEERKNLEKLSKDLKIDNIVEFLGYKEKNQIEQDIFPNIDILVNPSYQEWLPTTVVEWLLNKSVVIATNVWWTREISDKQDLILFNSWDTWKLTEKLEFAINNYKDLSWLSYNSVKEKFDWNNSIGKYHKVYE